MYLYAGRCFSQKIGRVYVKESEHAVLRISVAVTNALYLPLFAPFPPRPDPSLQCLLVKGWKSSAAWGFPKGKINQSESHRDCAVRETYEETGFDCSQMVDPESLDWMELSVREQTMRLYIVPGISKATVFETQTRKEISVSHEWRLFPKFCNLLNIASLSRPVCLMTIQKIEWFKLSDLPTWKQSQAAGNGGLASASTTGSAKFYLVTPFIGKLKHWIRENKQRIQQQQKRDQRPFEQSRDAVVPPSEPAAMRQSVPEVLNPETVIAKGREEAHRSERKHDSNGAQTRANQQSDSAALLSMLTGSLDLTPKASESQPLESQPVKDSRSSPEEPTDIPGISQPDEERDQKRKALLAHLLRGEPSHQPAKASQYPSPAFSRESESTEREGALLALLRGQDSHYPSNHANEMRSHPPHAQSPLPAHLLPPNYTAHCGQSMREQPQPASPDVGRASLLEMLNAGPMHSPRAPSTLGQIPFPAQSQTGHGYLNGLAPSHPHSGGGHFSPAMSLPPPPFARSPHFAPSINGWGYPSTAWQHPPASASPSPRPAVPPTHHAMPPSAHPGYAQNNFALPPGPRPVYQESPHPAYREHSQAPQNPLLSLLNGQSASTTSEAR